MSAAPKTVFLDIETTGLDPAAHEVWEIALIERRPGDQVDGSYHWFLKPKRLHQADPNALQVNRFYERTKDIPGHVAAESHQDGAPGSPSTKQWTGEKTVAREVACITAGAVLVGSNPFFDMTFLTILLRTNGFTPAWHYRPIDVATLGYGYELGAAAVDREEGEAMVLAPEVAHPRISSTHLSSKQSIAKPDGKSAHTAMADARWARDWFDALVGGAA